MDNCPPITEQRAPTIGEIPLSSLNRSKRSRRASSAGRARTDEILTTKNTKMRTTSIDNLIGIGADVVLLDPPFRFACWSAAGEGKSPQRQYRRSMSAEIAWLGRIGAPKRVDRGVASVIVAPPGRHSAKLIHQYQHIERIAGPSKVFAELFTRGSGPPAHWHAAGDELDLDAAPTPTVTEVLAPIYDPITDVWRGVSKAYAQIRWRQAVGGSGWSPR